MFAPENRYTRPFSISLSPDLVTKSWAAELRAAVVQATPAATMASASTPPASACTQRGDLPITDVDRGVAIAQRNHTLVRFGARPRSPVARGHTGGHGRAVEQQHPLRREARGIRTCLGGIGPRRGLR